MKRIQRSFAGGEISRFVYPLTEFKKRISGLAKSKNGIIRKFGSYENRPGTEFVGDDIDLGFMGDARITPFVDSRGRLFLVCIEHAAIQVINIEGEVEFSGVGEPGFGLRLEDTQFAQQGNTLLITSPFHHPYRLREEGDSWTFGEFTTARDPLFHGGITVTVGNTSEDNTKYAPLSYVFAVTGVNGRGIETAPNYVGTGAAKAIRPPGTDGQRIYVNVTNSTPQLYRNYNVYFRQAGTYYLVAVVVPAGSVTSYDYIGEPVDTTTVLPYEHQRTNWWERSGIAGDIFGTGLILQGGLFKNSAGNYEMKRPYTPHFIARAPLITHGPFLLRAETHIIRLESNLNIGARLDVTVQNPNGNFPIKITDYFTGEEIPAPADFVDEDHTGVAQNIGNAPSVCSFYGQRLILASSLQEPEKIWVSGLNDYHDFSLRPVLNDAAPFDFEIFTNDFSKIKFIRGLLEPILFTGREEWSLGQSLTPTEVTPKPQTSYGIGRAAPVHAENSLIFVAGDNVVRDVGFNFQDGGYKGNDLTLFSSHIFEGKQIISSAFQRHPDPIFWAIADDGAVASMTYLREQNIFAWSQHDFGRKALDVAVVDGESDSYVYFLFEEENGRTYLERLTAIDRTDDRDFRFMDSHKYYDFRNKDSAKTVQLKSTHTTAPFGSTDDLMTLELTGHALDPMPAFIDLLDESGYIRLIVTGVVTPKTEFKVRVDDEVPRGFQNTSTSGWSVPVKEVDGLRHLNNRQVAVIADGSVLSSPNNRQAQHLQVVAEKVALGGYYSVICVGLPYVSDMKTLPIDLRGDDTVIDQNMIVNKIYLYVHNTRGLFIGSEEPESATSDVGLTSLKTNFDGTPEIRPENGLVNKVIEGSWDSQGEIIVRQLDPLPMNLQGILLTGDLADYETSRR